MEPKIEAKVNLCPQNKWYIKRLIRLNDNTYDGEICYLRLLPSTNSASYVMSNDNQDALDQIILKAIQAKCEQAKPVNKNDIRMFDIDIEEDSKMTKSEVCSCIDITINKVQKVHLPECTEELDKVSESFPIKVQYFRYSGNQIPSFSINCAENEYNEIKKSRNNVSTLSDRYKNE